MHDFAQLALPLYKLLKKGISFCWSPIELKAFDALKHALMMSPVLIYPSFECPFLLQIDEYNDIV